MKILIGNALGTGGKYLDTMQIAALVGIFCYLFAENFVLSGSWEVLSLRSIDDYAVQDSIHSMQKAIVSGDWARVFGFFDYAYGNSFWLLNSILLLPLYFVGDAQALIVSGRQLSLIFVFATIYLVGLIIERLRPEAVSLKYPVLVAIATMPMVTIISTKFHVNAQSIFFGVLAYYLLIREFEISRRSMLLSAAFGGVAVGFKLTAVLIAPLLLITLLDRARQLDALQIAKELTIFSIVFVFVAAIFTAPALLLFPFFVDELRSMYGTFILFKDMGSSEGEVSAETIIDAFRFYFSPLSLAIFFVLFVALIFDDVLRGIYFSLYIFAAIIGATFVVAVVVAKGPIYIATYLLSLAFFIPVGLLGISAMRMPKNMGPILAYSIVAGGLLYGSDHRSSILSPYDYWEMNRNEKTKKQLLALEDMRTLVYPLDLPVRILQDNSSIFPATRFTDGVDVAINYGDLKEKSTWGKFDYILLNSDTYYGKQPVPSPADDVKFPGSLEEMTRKILWQTGYFYGTRYRLIYSKHDALLYQLETE